MCYLDGVSKHFSCITGFISKKSTDLQICLNYVHLFLDGSITIRTKHLVI